MTPQSQAQNTGYPAVAQPRMRALPTGTWRHVQQFEQVNVGAVSLSKEGDAPEILRPCARHGGVSKSLEGAAGGGLSREGVSSAKCLAETPRNATVRMCGRKAMKLSQEAFNVRLQARWVLGVACEGPSQVSEGTLW